MWNEKKLPLNHQIAIVHGNLMALERITSEIDKQRHELQALLQSLEKRKEKEN